tara:strand:+ start:321 stop:854 length:534 start_codon:yes stop_codon:yes gene_type:complete
VVKITISGHPGSGTSTLVSGLCNHFNWNSLNGGEIFRQEAANNNMSLEEFGELCATDDSVDKRLDDILRNEICKHDGPEIVESRLSGWWAYMGEVDCVRLWLSVDTKSRAERVVSREGISFDEALVSNRERVQRDLTRYSELYGINPEDVTAYTHVIDASNIGIDDLIDKIVGILGD